MDPNYTPVQAQLPIPYSRTGCLQVLHRITQRYPELVDLPLDHIRKASSSPLQLTAALDKIAHAALDRKYVLIYD
ncbi:hypothetical protein [Ferrimonas marina]|uniref:hypothetical protein n=1 Tax=Ferrimonas marina TaxID=299255 RepID=UPI0011610174|nr:hypothetical protein [Ferrimonas marina]